MQHSETIELTPHAMTFIIGQKQLIDRLLMPLGINYTEFCILFLLLESGSPLLVEQISDYLIIGRRTVLSSLGRLEDEILIYKEDAKVDNRKMVTTLSHAGRCFIRNAVEEVNSGNSKLLHESLPTDELSGIMTSNMGYALDKLRGHTVSSINLNHLESQELGVNHFIYWKALIRKWSDCTHRTIGLSLAEYRMLASLSSDGEQTQGRLCRQLLLKKSKVSLYKAQLISRGLMVEAPKGSDFRENLLSITPDGRRLAENCSRPLSSIWQDAHYGLDRTEILTVEAWYARMYLNLIRINDDQ